MFSGLSGQRAVVFLLAGTMVTGAQSAELDTKAGHEIGVTATDYEYSEPSVMSLKATKFGIDYAGTHVLSGNRFVRAEARFATGKADYAGSGTKNDVPDHYYEIRGLLGKDYPFGGHTLSPYVGIGYRYLFNDLRGQTSTGNTGYRRESTYLTLPFGVTHHMKLDGQAGLLSTAEFDYLLRGQQQSKLSDMGLGQQDVTNRQRHGYGLRLGVTYQADRWSVGPFINVWRIKDSDVVNGQFEPTNKTVEAGVKVAYRFD